MKITWLHITIFSVCPVAVIVFVLCLIRKKCSKRTAPLDISEQYSSHQKRNINHEASRIKSSYYNPNFLQIRKPITLQPYFSWADHPSLVADALENGWPRFSFVASPSKSNETPNVEMTWEVFDESVEHMQKIQLNHGPRKSITGRDSGGLTAVRTALPLPGPQFANGSFPQEAYFEIKILPNHEEDEACYQLVKSDDHDDDGDNSNCNNFASGTNVQSNRNNKIEDGEDEIVLSLGLIGEGHHHPLKIPGTFYGSVAFNSSGSVYLDGMKLVEEAKCKGWGREGNVIGCGYNPAQKKVFFTVNAKLVNEIHCKTEEFEHPIYPTIAANTHVTVMVNLGQSPFKFEAANSKRTPNPCFITAHLANSPSTTTSPYYELDSKELFSMGRIDCKWKHRPAKSNESVASTGELDQEGDLFEIRVV